MDYLQVTIFTTHDGLEAVTGRLYRIGINGVEIEDEADFKEIVEENRKNWDDIDETLQKELSGETKVKVYLPKKEARESVEVIRGEMDALRAMDTAHAFGRLTLSLADVAEEDWAENWKRFFKPILVGDVLIRPSWEPLPENAAGHTVFTIDPGMTFGTGTHETTRLCILAAQKSVRPGCRVLDLGCGSGILSIISLLLGAKSASAVDIDPIAQDTVRQNAALNGIPAEKLAVYTGDLLSDAGLCARLGTGYSIVFANIVADVIIGLAPFVPAVLAPDGVFIASGIIDERRDEVAAALKACGLSVVEEQEEKGWRCLCCRRS